MRGTKVVGGRMLPARAWGAAIALAVLLLVALSTPLTAHAAEGDWPSFRLTADNNAVVDAPTPTTVQHTALRWARALGTSWSDSPTPPILVDGKLIEITGQTVQELDPATGKTLRAKKVLAGAPSFSYTPPTYADGIIYVPLAGIDTGKKDDDGNPILVPGIQAIDAETLEPEWVYKDSRQGQNWVAPAVKDGLVYGGFYSSDTGAAHFVCVRAKTGAQVWEREAKGGFYWSNPLIVGSSVIVGTGDGTVGDSGTGHVLALDLKTGKLVSSAKVAGDVHATAVYDAAGGYVFVTTTPGWLYRFNVNAKTGALSRPARVRVGAHCTTTPVVSGGRVYVGTNSGFAAGRLVCIDAATMKKEYAVDLGGPMQSSPVLSTGHLAQTGKVTLYCTINNADRGLVAVTVAPDATRAAQAKVAELYDESGHEQYGICSPIVGPDGTIYYKNDSGALFAVGATDDQAHARVVSLIRGIGAVGKQSGPAIRSARKAYQALSKAQQAAIPNYGTLQRAETRYAQLTKKPKRVAKKAARKTSRAAGKPSTAKGTSRASAAKRTRGAPTQRQGLPAAAQPAAASGLNPERNRATAVGLPPASGNRGSGSSASTARADRNAAASSESVRQSSAASKAKGDASKAKAEAKKHADDPPAATTPLPADSERGRVPAWVWLVVLAAAAAALIGLLAYRRRSGGKGMPSDGR